MTVGSSLNNAGIKSYDVLLVDVQLILVYVSSLYVCICMYHCPIDVVAVF